MTPVCEIRYGTTRRHGGRVPAARLGNRRVEKLWYLQRCDLLQRLSPDRLQQVERRCRVRQFAARKTIYLLADAANAIRMLASGRVNIGSVISDGKQSILKFIEPGEIFAELATLDAAERDNYAEAVVDSTVILIPSDEMHPLVEENPRRFDGQRPVGSKPTIICSVDPLWVAQKRWMETTGAEAVLRSAPEVSR